MLNYVNNVYIFLILKLGTRFNLRNKKHNFIEIYNNFKAPKKEDLFYFGNNYI